MRGRRLTGSRFLAGFFYASAMSDHASLALLLTTYYFPHPLPGFARRPHPYLCVVSSPDSAAGGETLSFRAGRILTVLYRPSCVSLPCGQFPTDWGRIALCFVQLLVALVVAPGFAFWCFWVLERSESESAEILVSSPSCRCLRFRASCCRNGQIGS